MVVTLLVQFCGAFYSIICNKIASRVLKHLNDQTLIYEQQLYYPSNASQITDVSPP